MQKSVSILWIGGDKRQIIAENVMHCLGWNTSACLNGEMDLIKGKSYNDWHLAIGEERVLIFPLPMAKERVYLNTSCLSSEPLTLLDIVNSIKPDSLVLGGKIPPEICPVLEEKKIRYIDYYNEELQIRNALPTAEGAIGIALCEMPVTISGSNALVLGYGRIGKLLSVKLQMLGARVTVAARKDTDIAMACAYGHDTFSLQTGVNPENLKIPFDVIFNTVPVCLFGRKQLVVLKKDTLYMDLASFPGGINPEEAMRCGIRTIQAQSLPGKYAPVSAGRILAETVVQILTKEGIMP